MCSICGHVPCLSRCPNAPDPPAIYTCKVCGEPIRAGYDYYELDGEYYHDDCFEDKAVGILLDQFGAMKSVAEVDRWD